MKESDLYKPLTKYFYDLLSRKYSYDVVVEETHKYINNTISNSNNLISEVSRTYNYKPDIIVMNKSNSNDLWIIEVKDDPLKLKDLYQTKRYAEIIHAKRAFLISTKPFNSEDDKYIKDNSIFHLKNFAYFENNTFYQSTIIIGIVNLVSTDSNINIDNIQFDEVF
jgi:hypothetical protein